MSQLVIFSVGTYYGVTEVDRGAVLGFYSPAFADHTNAEIFLQWLERWRRENPFDPEIMEQERVATAIVTFTRPLLGVEAEAIASRDELIAWFLESEPSVPKGVGANA